MEGGEPRRRTQYNPPGGLSFPLASLLDEIIIPERVSNDAEKMCGAHARYRHVCGVSCRGLSEGQLGIGCSIPGQNRNIEKRLIPTRLLDQSEWAGQTAS